MAYKSTMQLLNYEGKRKYLNQEERLRYFNSTLKKEPRIQLFSLMLIYTGARISEVLSLKKQNIDFSDRTVIIETLKKRRKGVFRQIPLPDPFLDKLRRFSKSAIHSDSKLWNFSRRTATRYISYIMSDAKISGPHASSKGLRHSFAINCVMKDIPLNLIQKWMGHSHISTTSIYLNFTSLEERKIAKKMWAI